MKNMTTFLEIYVYNWTKLENIILSSVCGITSIFLVVNDNLKNESVKSIHIEYENTLREFNTEVNCPPEDHVFKNVNGATINCIKLSLVEPADLTVIYSPKTNENDTLKKPQKSENCCCGY